MPSSRPPADRPPPERLALGEASRLLGVDPDTLRRWADEGRVPAFTTPGGHRRFERRALERLIAVRRTGPAGGLAGLGASQDRLSAAYRRRYGEHHGGKLDPRGTVPAAERESYREVGRSLVDALVRHLDETGPRRAMAEREAVDLAATLGERLAIHGVTLADGVSMFVSARRPFLAELSVVARRKGVAGSRIGELYDTSTGLLDRLLLAFVAAHESAALELAAADEQARRAGVAAEGADAAVAPADAAVAPADAAGPAADTTTGPAADITTEPPADDAAEPATDPGPEA